MGEIQRADPRTRRAAIIIWGVGVVVGVLMIAAWEQLQPFLRDWIARDLKVRSRIMLAVLTVLTAGPALLTAVYCWRLGQQIVGAERYPPSGLRLFRDTRVVTGLMARRYGRFIQALALALSAAVLLMVFFLWRVALSLEAG